MRTSSFLVIISVLAIALFMIGCAGKDGKIGPAGAQGIAGPSGNPFLYTYWGNDKQNCVGCHSDKVASWEGTAHASATINLVAAGSANATNPACLKCHTTGYDSIDHYGYDDAMTISDSASRVARLAALSNVQCEACHGAWYSRASDNTANIHQVHATLDDHLMTDGTSPSLCNKCHGMQIQTEWSHSLHGMMFDSAIFNTVAWTDSTFATEWVRLAPTSSWNNLTQPGQTANCWECHTSEGFVHANNPTDPLVAQSPTRAHMIGCATCHDPHGVEDFNYRNPRGNLYQLRNTMDFAVLYYNPNGNLTPPSSAAYGARPKGTNAAYGASMVCAQCHHDRNDTTAMRGQIQVGNSRFGPHHSPQFDDFVGGGCYEIDSLTLHKVDSVLCLPGTPAAGGTFVKYYNANRTTSHQTQADANGQKGCVMCHMPDVVDATVSQHSHANHTFKAELTTCATAACHGSQPSFAAVIASKGAHVTGLEDSVNVLRTLLPADTTTWGTGSSASQVKIHKAAYVMKYFEEDRSHGAHNPEYARALLTNAIAYLRSSIQ